MDLDIKRRVLFNGQIVMLLTKFVYILTARYVMLIWLSQQDIVFNLIIFSNSLQISFA